MDFILTHIKNSMFLDSFELSELRGLPTCELNSVEFSENLTLRFVCILSLGVD